MKDYMKSIIKRKIYELGNSEINECINQIQAYMKIQYSENISDHWVAEKLLHTTLVFGNPKASSITSVIIPTYNRPDKLIIAIKSALRQKISDINVIVVNDDTVIENQITIRHLLKSINDSRLSYYENKHKQGMFGNWNMGLAVCPTSSMTLLNDDDMLDQNIIKDYLLSNAGALLYVPRIRLKYSNKYSIVRNTTKKIMLLLKRIIVGNFNKYESIPFEKLIIGNTIHSSLGVFFNVKKAIAIGGFCETLYPSADVCFTSKYSKKEGIVYSNRILATYVWGSNISLKPEIQKMFILIDKSLKTYELSTAAIKPEWVYRAISNLCRLSCMAKQLNYQYQDSTLRYLLTPGLEIIYRVTNLFTKVLIGLFH